MRVGIVGWRGMVGSVLLQRMLEEKDFALIEALRSASPRVRSKMRATSPRSPRTRS